MNSDLETTTLDIGDEDISSLPKEPASTLEAIGYSIIVLDRSGFSRN